MTEYEMLEVAHKYSTTSWYSGICSTCSKQFYVKIPRGQYCSVKCRPTSYGMQGRKHTEVSKQKMSEVSKGRVTTLEHRQKISETLKKVTRRKHQFCKYGHDTFKVGRSKEISGGCRVCSVVKNAKRREIPYSLSDDQFAEIVNQECIYKCSECNRTGIDQIIAGKGYVVGNVQPMCGRHNQIKLDHDDHRFKILIKAIH